MSKEKKKVGLNDETTRDSRREFMRTKLGGVLVAAATMGMGGRALAADCHCNVPHSDGVSHADSGGTGDPPHTNPGHGDTTVHTNDDNQDYPTSHTNHTDHTNSHDNTHDNKSHNNHHTNHHTNCTNRGRHSDSHTDSHTDTVAHNNHTNQHTNQGNHTDKCCA